VAQDRGAEVGADDGVIVGSTAAGDGEAPVGDALATGAVGGTTDAAEEGVGASGLAHAPTTAAASRTTTDRAATSSRSEGVSTPLRRTADSAL
jgi:hypothetical protein